ncbi:MAG: hypothetical protein KatS3mg076_2025 [Candidatus Binatia bacterium]|nr:MAG: hypothetical protein KatS3mg076_2025 [Candidatus Binatia bacterium]
MRKRVASDRLHIAHLRLRRTDLTPRFTSFLVSLFIVLLSAMAVRVRAFDIQQRPGPDRPLGAETPR